MLCIPFLIFVQDDLLSMVQPINTKNKQRHYFYSTIFVGDYFEEYKILRKNFI